MISIKPSIGTRLRASVAVFAVGSCAVMLLGGASAGAAVTSFRPTDPSQVILKLGDSTSESQLSRLRESVIAGPTDVESLRRYVAALLALGGRTGNERYYGYAEQAIANAPQDVRTTIAMLHAQLLQHRHDFRASEAILSQVIARNPRDYEALLTRAQVRLHLHEPELALSDCKKLALNVDLLTSTTCTAQARVAMGSSLNEIERAYALVTTLLQSDGPDKSRSWSAGVAAEFAARIGNAEAATLWYRAAYEWDRDSHYARIAYADWLISRGQTDAAHNVARSGASNADILRAVLAKHADEDAAARQLQLAWREAEARGERAHLRDRARFELIVLKNAARAHATALDNFRDQRESEDALLLAQTASARNDVQAAALLKQWQTERRYVDKRIDLLLAGRQ